MMFGCRSGVISGFYVLLGVPFLPAFLFTERISITRKYHFFGMILPLKSAILRFG